MRDSRTLCLITSAPMRTSEAGIAFFRHLCAGWPSLAPSLYGLFEPAVEHFEIERIESFVTEVWRDTGMVWSRQEPKSEGMVRIGMPWSHSKMNIEVSDFSIDDKVLRSFLEAESVRINADFAYIHYFTEEQSISVADHDTTKALWLGPPTHELEKYIPEIAWTTVFGKPYIDLFGRAKLLSSPCHSVRELADNQILLELTARSDDLRRDFSGFEAVRVRVKEHLGTDAFFNIQKGVYGEYRVPKFSLEKRTRLSMQEQLKLSLERPANPNTPID